MRKTHNSIPRGHDLISLEYAFQIIEEGRERVHPRESIRFYYRLVCVFDLLLGGTSNGFSIRRDEDNYENSNHSSVDHDDGTVVRYSMHG